jgi:hypothetical protein
VVLIDFWTYSGINCLRSIPYVQAWAENARMPACGHRRPRSGVRLREEHRQREGCRRPARHHLSGGAFNSRYWPALSSMRKAAFAIIISASGSMSARSASSNNCLREAGAADVAAGAVAINAEGVQAPSEMRQVLSPET